ncbi:SRPBCC family protein [Sphaerisporangium sp. NPDC005289]|uniref:SRPBCC family protein n=1 Tax=Sphaerisporangium sp. NPDC005289 TaxID=3155247 RepID=UPI0033B65EA0
MTVQEETRLVRAPLSRVREILLDPRALPDWNPAFLTLGGPGHAAVGVSYPITVRGGLSGNWEYTAIEDERIDTAWHLPGFHENGTWLLRPRAEGGTVVTHGFQHQGPLARALSRAYRGVAELRLDRLSQRAEDPGR